MKRFFDLRNNSYNNYCDDINPEYMIEIPDNTKPYGLVEGAVVDISHSQEYLSEIAQKEKEIQIEDFKKQIEEIDKKRIRALAEPQLKDAETGQTWLEYYTQQIIAIRAQISSL